MSKNRLSAIQTKKQESEAKAHEEAQRRLDGRSQWEDEEKTARISMRVEPTLKATFEKQLPRYASITDVIRDYMIRVARGEEVV